MALISVLQESTFKLPGGQLKFQEEPSTLEWRSREPPAGVSVASSVVA